MIKKLRIFVFDYWHYLLFGIFALSVLLSVIYFNQQQYENRTERLSMVSIDRVELPDREDPTAEPDSPIDGMLLPPRHSEVPLPLDWSIRENWGDPVFVRERRIPTLTLQQAPSRTGPGAGPK